MNEKKKFQNILVVDDMAINIELLRSILKSDYKVLEATNGEKALDIARSDPKPDIILLDIMMPGMDGYTVCKQLKADPRTKIIPVIFITASEDIEDEQMAFELGAVDFITKPYSPPVIKARVRTHLALYDQNRELEQKVVERTEELNNSRLEIIKRLGRAAEFKDNETGLHVIRMSHYTHKLGLAAGMNQHDADILLNAAPMHDIGKIGIPDKILLKPGKLNDVEWKIMQTHCNIGAHIIGDDSSDLLAMAKVIALTHHEKFNGKGYPNGLVGENIPLVGRIVAIADVFDALTSERPYKDAWLVQDAIDLINKEAGEHFDPELVKYFIANLPEILEIKSRYAENE